MKQKLLFLSIPYLLMIGGCESSEDDLPQQDPIHLIYEFTPIKGSVGTEVVIHGIHFSEIPPENIVKFRDVEAEVTDADPNKLTVKVPANARTGKISITVRGITTISTEEFVVK